MSRFLFNSAITRSIQTVKPHVPLIRFRKGEADKRQIASSDNATSTSSKATKVSSTQLPLIEDHQLPKRFWRLPLDEAEIEAINSGGAV